MEFHNKLYQLRKQNGLSQEELANRLNVSRQTVSKWEIGDSKPDMEKLIAIHDLFGISLDELVLDKETEHMQDTDVKSEGDVKSENNADMGYDAKAECSDQSGCDTKSEIITDLKEKVFTTNNKKKAKKGFKIAGIVFAIVLLIDFISMLIYVSLYGFPK